MLYSMMLSVRTRQRNVDYEQAIRRECQLLVCHAPRAQQTPHVMKQRRDTLLAVAQMSG